MEGRFSNLNTGKVNTGFHQTAANYEKMGAYYTDTTHCRELSKFFIWPAEEEVSILEPSIGDATAVCAVVNKITGDNKKLFGVELNPEAEKNLRESSVEMEALLNSDFLKGNRIKNNAFSFCFSNPPYMDNTNDGYGRERMEKLFLQNIAKYMKKDGVLCWVIPYGTLRNDDGHMRTLYQNFDIKHIYRFHEKEYAKWKQIVIIAIKNRKNVYKKSDYEALFDSLKDIQDIPELPTNYEGDKILVPPSNSTEITPFASQIFRPERAYSTLTNNTPLNNFVGNNLSCKPFAACNLGRPPIPPKNDSKYLLTVCGVGHGKVGTPGIDAHLQRGVVTTAEDVEVIVEMKDGDQVEVQKVVSRANIEMTIIQNDGTISVLS